MLARARTLISTCIVYNVLKSINPNVEFRCSAWFLAIINITVVPVKTTPILSFAKLTDLGKISSRKTPTSPVNAEVLFGKL